METKKTFGAIAALLLTLSSLAQTPYKGKVTVSNHTLIRQGDLLRLKMRVSYGTDVLNAGETLVITPVLKDDSHHCQLSSVVVPANVTSIQRTRGNFPVVAESANAREKWFDYDTTVPFAAWMHNAAFYIESEEKDAKSSHIYEDQISSTLDIACDSSRCAKPEWIDLIFPSSTTSNLVTISSTIDLVGKNNIGKMKTRKFNETIAKHIEKSFRECANGREMSLKEVVVRGYGAPIGNIRRNTIRSEVRAFELRNHLISATGLGAQTVHVSWIPEDWDSIATLVDATDMPLRAASLDVIRTVDVCNGREEQLQMLGSGHPYKYMQRNIFPKVCRIEYSLTLEDTSADKLRHDRFLTSTRSGNLSVAGLTMAASSYVKSSHEYSELLDVAVRLHPTDPVARINAAGAALIHGDLNKASKLLADCQSDPRSYTNLGILFLLRGDSQKASIYFQMAGKKIEL